MTHTDVPAVAVVWRDDGVDITLDGDIDERTARRFAIAVADALDRGRDRLDVDCREIGLLDTSGVDALEDAVRRLGEGCVTLWNPSALLREALAALGFGNCIRMRVEHDAGVATAS